MAKISGAAERFRDMAISTTNANDRVAYDAMSNSLTDPQSGFKSQFVDDRQRQAAFVRTMLTDCSDGCRAVIEKALAKMGF